MVSDNVLADGPFGFRTAIELHPGRRRIRLRNKAYNGPFFSYRTPSFNTTFHSPFINGLTT